MPIAQYVHHLFQNGRRVINQAAKTMKTYIQRKRNREGERVSERERDREKERERYVYIEFCTKISPTTQKYFYQSTKLQKK